MRLEIEQKLRGAIAIVAVGLLAGMGLSWRLWLPLRAFPSVPVIEGLEIPIWLAAALSLVVVAAVVALCLRPKHWLLWVLLSAFLLLWLTDQSRLQPWAVLYSGLLLALVGLGSGRNADPRLALTTCKLLLAAMYFWSGLQKLNPGFAGRVVPWLTSGLEHWLQIGIPEPPLWLGYAIAGTELAIGIALLVPLTSRLAAVGGIAMHLLILATLGPWGLNWNSVVWPWNAAAAALLALLFLTDKEPAVRRSLLSRPLAAGLTLLFGVLPALSLFGIWDSFFSHVLYCGNEARGYITLDAAAYERLPPAVRKQALPRSDGHRLDIVLWSLRELNAPPYLEPRTYLAIARALAREAGGADGIELTVVPRQSQFGERCLPITYSQTLLEP